MRAVAEVQADQVAQQVGVGLGQLGAVVVHEERRDAVLDLGLRHLDAVGVGDLQPPGQHVAQQAERLVLRPRVGAAVEAEVHLGSRLGPVGELVEQAALADTGIGHHQQHLELPLLEQASERDLQAAQFGFAADHARGDALDAARRRAKGTRLGPHHQVRGDGLLDALDRDRRLRLEIEHAPHQTPRLLADPQSAGRRGLLHARGDIHRHPADAAFGVDATAQQHAPGVHADADVEPVVPVGAPHLQAQHVDASASMSRPARTARSAS